LELELDPALRSYHRKSQDDRTFLEVEMLAQQNATMNSFLGRYNI
jgi:hypothetical protein